MRAKKFVQIITDNYPNLKLLAVTKGQNIEKIKEILHATGLNAIGENRLDEALKKYKTANLHLEKHFLGKLQSRKIAQIVEFFDVIQSVESIEQAEKIAFFGRQFKKIPKIYLQINITGQQNRSGASPSDAMQIINELKNNPDLQLVGVMGMASLTDDENKIQSEFRLLKSFQGDLSECSMGMSSDYNIAIKEGSTLVRLGRILFE